MLTDMSRLQSNHSTTLPINREVCICLTSLSDKSEMVTVSVGFTPLLACQGYCGSENKRWWHLGCTVGMTWTNNWLTHKGCDHTVQMIIKSIYPGVEWSQDFVFASVRTMVVQLGMLLQDFPTSLGSFLYCHWSPYFSQVVAASLQQVLVLSSGKELQGVWWGYFCAEGFTGWASSFWNCAPVELDKAQTLLVTRQLICHWQFASQMRF